VIPPEVVPEPGWREFVLPFEIGSGRSMFVETTGGPTIRMRFFERVADGTLVGRVWFGRAAFGPPGHVHGGVVAYVMDEAMGAAAWLAGYPCVAANLGVDFALMTPLGHDCAVESSVVTVEPRKLIVEGSLALGDRTLVKARGTFVRIRRDRMEQFGRDGVPAGFDPSRLKFAT